MKTGLNLTFMSGKYTRFSPRSASRTSTFLIKRAQPWGYTRG